MSLRTEVNHIDGMVHVDLGTCRYVVGKEI